MAVLSLSRRALAAAAAASVAAPIWLAASAGAQGLPRAATPEEVDLSAERLKRLSDRMNAGVDKGEIPGAVVLVARRGKVAYFESFGLRDPESRAAMAPDAIFRIASMTKPIVSLAIMMLAEEGKLSIADAASIYLPEFKALKVGV